MLLTKTEDTKSNIPGQAIVIVGINRGGTSAVAASLASLGVFLGDLWHDPIYEDLHLAHHFRSKNWREFRNRIHDYEGRHEIFAWKLPDSASKLGIVDKNFTNAKYIFVFRDLYATSDRMKKTNGTAHLQGMFKACLQYLRVLFFIKRKHPNCLLVSYEKMITDTEGYARRLLEFIEWDINQDNLNKILESVSPSPAEYQKWATITKQGAELKKSGYAGHLDHVDQFKISGWAKRLIEDEPIYVDLYVNQSKVATVLSDCYRQDLKDSCVSGSGLIGFNCELSEPLKVGDEVSVFPAGTTIDLIGSPRQLI